MDIRSDLRNKTRNLRAPAGEKTGARWSRLRQSALSIFLSGLTYRPDGHPCRLHCVIKVGGAAITKKNQECTLDEEVLTNIIQMIAQLHQDGLRFIVIHGAGSFGHIQAKRNPVQTGGIGVALVRSAVTKLSHTITEKLAQNSVNAVMVSPFPSWQTKTIQSQQQVTLHNSHMIQDLVDRGLVPIIHGDVVVDTESKFSILSGDVIATVLAEALKPNYVVFLSDIQGIFTAPPEQEGSKLLNEILVNQDGSFLMPHTSVKSDFDVTGGIDTKLSEAGRIAQSGIDVYFAQAGTEFALDACRGIKPKIGTLMKKL